MKGKQEFGGAENCRSFDSIFSAGLDYYYLFCFLISLTNSQTVWKQILIIVILNEVKNPGQICLVFPFSSRSQTRFGSVCFLKLRFTFCCETLVRCAVWRRVSLRLRSQRGRWERDKNLFSNVLLTLKTVPG